MARTLILGLRRTEPQESIGGTRPRTNIKKPGKTPMAAVSPIPISMRRAAHLERAGTPSPRRTATAAVIRVPESTTLPRQ